MTPITLLLLYSLSAYALTFVIASSAIFEPLRNWIMPRTAWMKIGNHKHMIECRMCTGFWMAVLVCNTDYTLILPVYGLSYFLCTQER